MSGSIKKEVSTKDLFLYACGSGTVGVNNVVFGTYLLIYYNQVLGLNPALASLAISISLIFDAISDPLIGAWSDRVKTKIGRRHPFVYFSIIPLALCFYFLFSDPLYNSQSYLFWKLMILVILVRLALTFYETPRAALGPELTKDYDRRNLLNGMGMSMGFVGGIFVSFVMLGFFLEETEALQGANAYFNTGAYENFGVLAALMTIIFGFISALSTHKYIPHLHNPKVESKFSLKDLKNELLESLSNRPWLILVSSGCFYALSIGITYGTGTYIGAYFWQWTPEDVAAFPLVSGISAILGAITAVVLATGREKKVICVSVFFAATILTPMPYWLRLSEQYFAFSLFPANGTDLLWWVICIHTGITDFLAVMGFVLVISMAFDVVENSQTKTGRRDEGLFLSGPGLIQKVLTGLGLFILGIVLQLVGFDAQGTISDMQDPIYKLVTFQSTIAPLLTITAAIILIFYNISRESHNEALDKLGYK